jgi:Fe/S biogenesis protein NfuA
MISLTETARDKVSEFIDKASGDCAGLRVAAHKQGQRTFLYDLTLVLQGESSSDDLTIDAGAFKVFVDPDSAKWLQGTTIDFVSDDTGSGFKIDNPQAKTTWDDAVAQRVQEVLDERVAPALASHGGWVELVGVEGEAALIQFGGGCQGCGMSSVTLKQGIETAIVEAVPEITQVVDKTDHDAGANPYHCG